MINLINLIPESVGWAMVGFVSACDVFVIGSMIRTIIKARKADIEEEE